MIDHAWRGVEPSKTLSVPRPPVADRPTRRGYCAVNRSTLSRASRRHTEVLKITANSEIKRGNGVLSAVLRCTRTPTALHGVCTPRFYIVPVKKIFARHLVRRYCRGVFKPLDSRGRSDRHHERLSAARLFSVLSSISRLRDPRKGLADRGRVFRSLPTNPSEEDVRQKALDNFATEVTF